MSGSVSRKERAPWKPERGQRFRVIGRLSVSEWAGFTIAMTTVIFFGVLLIVAIVAVF